MKLLLTGFDAFEGEKVNSSEEVVKRFRGKKIKNIQVNTKVLPTVFSKAPKELIAEIEKERPDFVICLGQVGGRAHISLERTATNLIDDSLKDNEGISIQGKKIAEDGPDSYFSTLPIDSMRENLLDNGIPATISNSAQNFICNQVFYALMHHAKSKNIKAAGLVHIPLLPSQAAEHYKKMQTKTVVQGLPSMHIETITKAVELIIETL